MRQAADFAAESPKYAQPPSGLGADHLSNILTNLVFATAGGLGGGSSDPASGAAGALAGFFARRGARSALQAIYSRAAQRADREAMRHASRLLALSQGAMTGAKAQLVKESAEALLRAGYGDELE
jgi:hypothetical protein